MIKSSDIKKYFLFILPLLFFLAIFSNVVFAQTGSGNVGNNPSGSGSIGDGGSGALFTNPINVSSFEQLVFALMTAIIKIGWVVVIFAIIYVGFKFVMASGNENKLKDAKTALLYTIIGGVILLGSTAISEIICRTVGSLGGQCILPNSNVNQ